MERKEKRYYVSLDRLKRGHRILTMNVSVQVFETIHYLVAMGYC